MTTEIKKLVLDLYRIGLSGKEIVQKVKDKHDYDMSTNAIKQIVYKARKKGRMRPEIRLPEARKLGSWLLGYRILMSQQTQRYFDQQAQDRSVMPEKLIANVLRIIAQDNMVANIIDEEELV